MEKTAADDRFTKAFRKVTENFDALSWGSFVKGANIRQSLALSPNGKYLYMLVVEKLLPCLKVVSIDRLFSYNTKEHTTSQLKIQTIYFKPSLDSDVFTNGPKLVMNPSGTHLAISGECICYVVTLPTDSHYESDSMKFTCPVIEMKSSYICQIAWHPLSDLHLCVLEEYDFVMYKIGGGKKVTEAVFGHDDCISFSFPTCLGWNAFSILFMNSDGNIKLLCPLVPDGCVISEDHYQQLEVNPHAFKRTNVTSLDSFMSQFSKDVNAESSVYRFSKKSHIKAPAFQKIKVHSNLKDDSVDLNAAGFALVSVEGPSETLGVYRFFSSGQVDLLIGVFPVQPDFQVLSTSSKYPPGSNILIKVSQTTLENWEFHGFDYTHLLHLKPDNCVIIRSVQNIHIVQLNAYSEIVSVSHAYNDSEYQLLKEILSKPWKSTKIVTNDPSFTDADSGVLVLYNSSGFREILAISSKFQCFVFKNELSQFLYNSSESTCPNLEIEDPQKILDAVSEEEIQASLPLVKTSDLRDSLKELRKSFNSFKATGESHKNLAEVTKKLVDISIDVEERLYTIAESVSANSKSCNAVFDLQNRLDHMLGQIEAIERRSISVSGMNRAELELASDLEKTMELIPEKRHLVKDLHDDAEEVIVPGDGLGIDRSISSDSRLFKLLNANDMLIESMEERIMEMKMKVLEM